MSKAIMDRIKIDCELLDPAELAMLAAWVMEEVEMDVPHPEGGCPHYEKATKRCRFPEVVA